MKKNNIKEFRKNSTLRQKDMAKALNISIRQYSRIENGVSSPDIWTAIRIADLLGVKDIRKIWNTQTI